MAGFNCKHCGFDLSLRIDLLAQAMQADHADGEFPENVAVDGCCENCKNLFHFSGEMFSKFLALKIEEGVIDPRTQNYAILEFDIGEDEAEHFRQLMKDGHKDKAKAFMLKLMIRDERPDKQD